MSLWSATVGSAPGPGTQDPAALLVDAMGSVTADASVVAALSPQSRIMLVTVQSAVEGVVGDVAKEAILAMSPHMLELIGETCTAALGTVIEAIPFIGQVATMVMLVVDEINGKEAQKAAQEAARQQACQQKEAARVPVGTGPQVMPCDIVSVYDAADIQELLLKGGSAGDVESENARPTIGESIIRLTEGWSNGHREPLAKVYAMAQSNPTLLKILGLQRDKAWAGDVPKDRQLLHAKIRKAIETTRKHAPRTSTDGGASLWPVILDMMEDERKRGFLTTQYMTWLLGHFYSQKGAAPLPCVGTAPARAAAVNKLLTDWQETINPWYSGGAEKQKEVEERAAEIARAVGEGRSQTTGRLVIHTKQRFKLATPAQAKTKVLAKRVVKVGAGVGVLWGLWRLFL